ncbi:hypothetical protein EGW08_014762 [Elysia chlorotica]|uniref:Amine oxidase n=1 Tax=Elysia chlorotica TaxID=188477 RepID=A0A433T7B2_ELYCH|nr:hypothetical protein EGW08_014762 [Elysia chlorotica]
MDVEKDESMSRLINGVSYSDEEDAGEHTNGHLSNGKHVNRRHEGSTKRSGHRLPILTTVLTVSLLANILLLLLLYKDGDTASQPTFGLSSQIPVSCDQQSDQQSDQPSAPVHIENASQALVSCPEIQLTKQTPLCSKDHENSQKLRAEAKKYQNIFKDLSDAEIRAVFDYLNRQKALGIKPYEDDTGNHVYSIELHVPNKTAALLFLQGRGPRPPREAQVVMEQPQAWATPMVQELVVGPLPQPTYHKPNPRRRNNSVPYRFHPSYGVHAAYQGLARLMNPSFDAIVRESYGASFLNCQNRCLVLLSQKTSSAYSETTLIVLTAYYPTDFVTINPLDLMFVMKETRKDSGQFQLDSLEYGGQTFPSVQEFVQAYRHRETPMVRRTFPAPVPGETSYPGTMNLRGQNFPETSQEGPRQFEPDGKRYVVENQHVRYMKWSFNLRMSTASGPQVWDVRWAGERIAYEISLQDVAVIYAGANPTTFYAHLSDSAFGLGDKAYGLVPGVDCPDHATFLPVSVYNKTRNGPSVNPNAFCIFEHNNGVPLRRHRSDDATNGRNYGGLVDRVLIVRTVLVEYNYDYIFDVVFHLNGAVEVTSQATGYVMSQHYRTAEKPFGFRNYGGLVDRVLIVRTVLVEYNYDYIFDVVFHLNGAVEVTSHATGYVMSQHYRTAEKPFGFRYKSLDFTTDKRSWPWLHAGQTELEQISFREHLRQTELDAVLHYNFSQPKYHLVFNDAERNKFGHHRAYSQILPSDSPVLRSRTWTKYQMLVTERKEEEEASSSIFSMFDGASPHVDVERYLADNGSLVDKDLVLWMTIGFHHIPHTEDIPNTPTVGARASISILPYNYFPECPSVGSRDAVRIDAKGTRLYSKYGLPRKDYCLPNKFDYESFMKRTSSMFPE